VLNGDENLIKGGAQTALYYFQLEFAIENAYHALDSLKSLPVLNDGVFCHTADWGAVSYYENESTIVVNYIFNRHSPALLRYFKINPTILTQDKQLTTMISQLDSDEANQSTTKIKYSTSVLIKTFEINFDGIIEVKHEVYIKIVSIPSIFTIKFIK
jgi:hypothetical protein